MWPLAGSHVQTPVEHSLCSPTAAAGFCWDASDPNAHPFVRLPCLHFPLTATDRTPCLQLQAYVEVHLEQGPVLEAAGRRLGAVAAIAGQSRLLAEIVGEQVCRVLPLLMLSVHPQASSLLYLARRASLGCALRRSR